MRKRLFIALALPLLTFAMGERAVPQNFVPAKVVDNKGVVHEVSALVCDGKTYFTFEDGSVYLKVPFTKLKKLVVEGKKGDKLLVEAYFTDGGKKALLIDSDVECMGPTPYGTIDAFLSQVKEIDFEKTTNGR